MSLNYQKVMRSLVLVRFLQPKLLLRPIYKLSIHMAASLLRYDILYQLLAEHSLDQIATAHHWDDTIETLMLNFVKGTAIMGLQGIPPHL